MQYRKVPNVTLLSHVQRDLLCLGTKLNMIHNNEIVACEFLLAPVAFILAVCL